MTGDIWCAVVHSVFQNKWTVAGNLAVCRICGREWERDKDGRRH